MGSPAHPCTSLSTRGGKSMPPLKLLGELDLNRKVKDWEWLSKGSKCGKSWRPQDCSWSFTCITAVKNISWERNSPREGNSVLCFWWWILNDLSAALSDAKYESNRTTDLSQHSNSPVSEAALQYTFLWNITLIKNKIRMGRQIFYWKMLIYWTKMFNRDTLIS